MLGVIPNVKYEQHVITLNHGDFVVIMTDGVTECRSEDGFIEQQKVMEIIEHVRDEPAQDMAEYVFKELEKLQNFELRDDFTIVILKKV